MFVPLFLSFVSVQRLLRLNWGTVSFHFYSSSAGFLAAAETARQLPSLIRWLTGECLTALRLQMAVVLKCEAHGSVHSIIIIIRPKNWVRTQLSQSVLFIHFIYSFLSSQANLLQSVHKTCSSPQSM